MTAIDYAALIERLTRKNEDGTLCEITEADQQASADALERLTQPVGVEPETDSYVQKVPDKCDRIVWRKGYYHLPLDSAETVARLIAERDAAQGKYDDLRYETMGNDLLTNTLQEQVKTLRAALNDATDLAIGHYGVDSRVAKMALEALAATEPKEKP